MCVVFKLMSIVVVHVLHMQWIKKLWSIPMKQLKTQNTHLLVYLKHKGVIELWLAAFAPGLCLTMMSILSWQEL